MTKAQLIELIESADDNLPVVLRDGSSFYNIDDADFNSIQIELVAGNIPLIE